MAKSSQLNTKINGENKQFQTVPLVSFNKDHTQEIIVIL
jgi:hypothetical protein